MNTTISPQSSAAPEKSLRLYDMSQGRQDTFHFFAEQLEPREGWNLREDYGDLGALADNLEEFGVLIPFIIEKPKGSNRIFIDEGNRRWTAITTILIPQGRWQDPKDKTKQRIIPCNSEKPGTKPIDRLWIQLVANSGKPFTFLEEARVYQAILKEDPTLKAADIARRTGKTKQAISDSLKLVNDGTPALLDAVKANTLAGTTANKIIDLAKTSESDQDSILTAALQTAEAAGRDHILPKDIPALARAGTGWKLHVCPRSAIQTFGKATAEDEEHHITAENYACYRYLEWTDNASDEALHIGWNFNGDGMWSVGWWIKQGTRTDGQHADFRLASTPMFKDLRDGINNAMDMAMEFFGWDVEAHEDIASRALCTLESREFRNKNMPAESKAEKSPAKDAKAPSGITFTFRRSVAADAFHTTNDSDAVYDPDTCKVTGLPKAWRINTLVMEFARFEDGTNDYSYDYGTSNGGGGGHPGTPGTEGVSEHDQWLQAWDDVVQRIVSSARSASGGSEGFGDKIQKGFESLKEDFEAALTAHLATADATTPAFTLYLVEGAPETPDKEGRYHETDRLALGNLPTGIKRLHLLTASDKDHQIAYGYRFNDLVHLPDPKSDSYGMNAEEGFAHTLENIPGLPDEHREQFKYALFDALCRYYPESGTPEQPEHLAFAEEPAPPEATGYQAILGAAATNYNGTGSGSGGGGGFIAPDKAMDSIDKMMEGLTEKERESSPFVNTVEIVLRVLRNESPVSNLKAHLLGKV